MGWPQPYCEQLYLSIALTALCIYATSVLHHSVGSYGTWSCWCSRSAALFCKTLSECCPSNKAVRLFSTNSLQSRKELTVLLYLWTIHIPDLPCHDTSCHAVWYYVMPCHTGWKGCYSVMLWDHYLINTEHLWCLCLPWLGGSSKCIHFPLNANHIINKQNQKKKIKSWKKETTQTTHRQNVMRLCLVTQW